jgi:hypothetical protein
MCCFFLALVALGPRFALLMIWLFGDRVELAFDSWIWPLLGVVFLPWTTLAYVLSWSAVGGVSGGEWVFVAIGFVADLATYSARKATDVYRART